jgi:hypothetical protein
LFDAERLPCSAALIMSRGLAALSECAEQWQARDKADAGLAGSNTWQDAPQDVMGQRRPSVPCQ